MTNFRKANVIVVGAKSDPIQPNMGALLIKALRDLGHEVACVLTTKGVFKIREDGGWDHVETLAQPLKTEETIAKVLDQYIGGVDAICIAIPADPKVELAYINYGLKRGVYIDTIAKGALSEYWKDLQPHLPMLGYYGAVGGRSLVLPWLKLQQLPGKKFILYAYWNATVECFFEFTAGGNSTHEGYRMVKAMSLAEPGSSDYVSCINIEIGGDYVRKIPIAVNEAMIGPDGPFMTPAAFDKYVSLEPKDFLGITTRGERFALCISSTGDMPLEVEKGMPGTLSAEFGGLTILGGFCDPKRNVNLDGWMKGGAKNGAKIIFQNGTNESGQTEVVGEGAGPDTVWSAIINLNEYLARRPAINPKPVREGNGHSVAENAAARGLLGPFEQPKPTPSH